MTASTGSGPPLRILVCAIGGEGGSVLMNWIVAAARSAGFRVQATSVPGVAQRTGGTSYYVEVAEPDRPSVLALVPMPGRVDIVLSSELLETARVLEAGLVSKKLTTVISSTSRTYTTAEKITMGDGRYDGAPVAEAVRAMARAAYLVDLQAIASENGTFISATMFGALAASGALPWPEDLSRQAMGGGDSPAARASRAGFDAAAAAVRQRRGETNASPVAESDLPDPLARVIAQGCDRLADFQDEAYADAFREHMASLTAVCDPAVPGNAHALTEAARRLALWMAYEDIPRVADLKTRSDRFVRIRAEAELRPGDILKITEYLKPRAEELADMLPVRLGERVMARVAAGKGLPLLGRGIRVRSNGVLGFWLLRAIASLRRFRRGSLRYRDEQAAIAEWLMAMRAALAADAGFAGALVELPRVRKGYSDTLARGLAAYGRIMRRIVQPALARGPAPEDAARLRRALAAALADENHAALDAMLGGGPGQPNPTQIPNPENTNAD